MSHKLDVTTTNGEVFSHEQSCQMAELVYLRFGGDLRVAAGAWRRLMQNSTSTGEFAALIEGALTYKLSKQSRAVLDPPAGL